MCLHKQSKSTLQTKLEQVNFEKIRTGVVPNEPVSGVSSAVFIMIFYFAEETMWFFEAFSSSYQK